MSLQPFEGLSRKITEGFTWSEGFTKTKLYTKKKALLAEGFNHISIMTICQLIIQQLQDPSR